jgi:hypothetical protein
MIRKISQFDRQFYISLTSLPIIFLLMQIFGHSGSLDIKLYYTGDQARFFLTSLSAEQNRAYLVTELIDFFLFIPAYSLTLFFGIKQLRPLDRKMWLWAFAPGFFDIIETLLIINALISTSNQSYFDWLGLMTFFKWLLGLGAVITFFRNLRQPSQHL